MAIDKKELDIFAKTLYFEAGSTCDIFEVLFLAWVIRNRVEGSSWFGSDYQKVCLKRYQFSCWNGVARKEIDNMKINNFRFKMCLFIAEYVMRWKGSENPIPKTCYYYEPTLCSPKWARKMKRIYPQLKLKHIFFEDK
jgi:spore germination cell wall hydrolase CwlJ-like protein